jgi:hypothetical protein
VPLALAQGEALPEGSVVQVADALKEPVAETLPARDSEDVLEAVPQAVEGPEAE